MSLLNFFDLIEIESKLPFYFFIQYNCKVYNKHFNLFISVFQLKIRKSNFFLVLCLTHNLKYLI